MSIEQVSGADSDQLGNALGDARMILLLGSDSPDTEDVCSALLTVARASDTHLLSVTFDGTPDEQLDALQSHFGQLPAKTGVISVGETMRSAASTGLNGPRASTVSVDNVADPTDLTGLGMSIDGYLNTWSQTTAIPVVCFDSVTSLLFHAETISVFRFLHSTTGRLRDVGAISHYHLDPDAHEESTINSFAALFDAVVEVGADGAVSVRKRR